MRKPSDKIATMPPLAEGDEDAARAAAVIDELEMRCIAGTATCARCGASMCGHEVVVSLAMGFKNVPTCLTCLANGLGRDRAELRDHAARHISNRDCFMQGWRWASAREGFEETTMRPGCLWPQGELLRPAGEAPAATGSTPATLPPPRTTWDAGSLRCSDLLMELRLRMKQLRPGDVLAITAQDGAAHGDLSSWCSLTGHKLVLAEPPRFAVQHRS